MVFGNPLDNTITLQFWGGILNGLVIILLPVIIVAIVYAGFTFVTAGGDAGMLKRARTIFILAVFGGMLALGARTFITSGWNTYSVLGQIGGAFAILFLWFVYRLVRH